MPVNNEIPFRRAGQIAGLAYNTIRRMRYQGVLPFPVHERTIIQGQRPKLYCLVSEIEAWKKNVTVKVPAAVRVQ